MQLKLYRDKTRCVGSLVNIKSFFLSLVAFFLIFFSELHRCMKTSQKLDKGITGSPCHYVIICHLSASQRVIRNIVSSCWSGNVICSIWFNFHIQQSNCTPKRRGKEARSSFVSWSLWWWAWVNRESTVLPLWTSLFPFYHFWPFSKWLITDR